MSNHVWIRARKREQVEQRIRAILDAAGRVFQSEQYETVTMQKIAKEAGFTRSNLYRYFTTREEIFLALYLSDIDSWVEELQSALTEEESIPSFVRRWNEILCHQHRLLELTPLLTLSLEKNTSEDVYRRTKQALYDRMNAMIPYLQKTLPSLSVEEWFEFFLTHQAVLAGLWPMTQHSEMQQRVLDELALTRITIDFASFYENVMVSYLRGIGQRSKQN